MKTADILMIAAGVGIAGYLIYKNKDQFQKPLTDSDNAPLRSGFDTGTNNGNGYRTEEEKPASDPVVLSKALPFSDDIIKEPVTTDRFETGEYLPGDIPSTQASTEMFTSNELPIPRYNTTTPFAEEAPVLKPLVAEVSPSAPVVSITETKEQPTTLLYNNSAYNIAPADSYTSKVLVDAF